MERLRSRRSASKHNVREEVTARARWVHVRLDVGAKVERECEEKYVSERECGEEVRREVRELAGVPREVHERAWPYALYDHFSDCWSRICFLERERPAGGRSPK